LRQGKDEVLDLILRREKYKAKCKIAELLILVRNIKRKNFDKSADYQLQLSSGLQKVVVNEITKNIKSQAITQIKAGFNTEFKKMLTVNENPKKLLTKNGTM